MLNMFPASAMPDSNWWEALWPEPERTVAALGVKPGMQVIDLCCGDGLFTLPIARLAAEKALGKQLTLIQNRVVLASQSTPMDPIRL